MFKPRHHLNKKGFTLIELMTALSVFTIVMTISMGSILGVFDANRKSRSLKTVMNNLNLAMESMSKEMRYGYNYHCGPGNRSTPQSCPEGRDTVYFVSSDGEDISYRFNNASIEKSVGSESYSAITAPEVVIDNLTFYVLGAGTGDGLHPRAVIKVSGHSGTGKSRSDFVIQTLVSQRMLDN